MKTLAGGLMIITGGIVITAAGKTLQDQYRAGN